MSQAQLRTLAPRHAWHVLALIFLCAVAFFPGLDRHGVTNWQEAQRLIVAREMQARSRNTMASRSTLAGFKELLVPRSNGKPYLAKPPMIYWSQIGLANAMGQRVELWHLRAVVALAGLLGVLATYGAARELLRPHAPAERTPKSVVPSTGPLGIVVDAQFVDRAAFSSAAMLATGLLYVRSGRIGELDILLVPLCTTAIWAVARAWRTHQEQRRTNFGAVVIAMVATALATLTKDPAVMVVALAAYGGIALWIVFAPSGTLVDTAVVRRRGGSPLQALPEAGSGERPLTWTWAAAFGVPSVLVAASGIESPTDILGALIIGLFAALLGLMFSRVLWPLRFRALFVAFSRTHPVLVLGGAVVVRLAWGWAVASMIGTESTGALARQEVEDNVRLLVPEAPLNNLEAMSFGVGVGSVAAIVTLIALLRDRFWPSRSLAGWCVLIAWLVFIFAAFSVLGKGVQRYLTPMWPALAMLGGLGVAVALAQAQRSRWLRPTLVVAILSLAAGQGWWYGYGRESAADRSPRDLVAELQARNDVLMYRLFSLEFATPALDYYLDRHVEVVGDARVNDSMAGGGAWSIGKLIRNIRRTGRPAFVLVRTGRIPGEPNDAPTAIERLLAAGLVASEVPTTARFRIDKGRSDVRCFKLRLPKPEETDASSSTTGQTASPTR